jgi:hypothetical protein
MSPPKTMLNMRVDRDTLDYLRALGEGFQTRSTPFAGLTDKCHARQSVSGSSRWSGCPAVEPRREGRCLDSDLEADINQNVVAVFRVLEPGGLEPILVEPNAHRGDPFGKIDRAHSTADNLTTAPG